MQHPSSKSDVQIQDFAPLDQVTLCMPLSEGGKSSSTSQLLIVLFTLSPEGERLLYPPTPLSGLTVSLAGSKMHNTILR